MGVLHWRLWRVLREEKGAANLRGQAPKPLPRQASKQIKSGKDARGKRRGAAEN